MEDEGAVIFIELERFMFLLENVNNAVHDLIISFIDCIPLTYDKSMTESKTIDI